MKRILSLAVASLLLSSVASANDQNIVLWDQAPNGDPAATAFVDQSFPDFPDFSTYLASDVVFGSAVTIDSVSTYFTNNNNTWPQNTSGTATLNIFADPLSGADDPAAGMSVTVDYTSTNDGITVTASGLGINLAAGTYWIGLTPELEFGTSGQEFHQSALGGVVGAETAARNPGGGFGLGTDWGTASTLFGSADPFDAAITVTGKVVPEPTTAGLLALGLVGLVARRRR